MLLIFWIGAGSRPAQTGTFIGRRPDAPTEGQGNTQPTQPAAQPIVQPTPQPQQRTETPQPVTAQSPTQPKQPASSPQASPRQQSRATPGRVSTTQRPQLTAPVTAVVNDQLQKLNYTVSAPAKLARDSVYATIKRRNRRSLYVSQKAAKPGVRNLTSNNLTERRDWSTACLRWRTQTKGQALHWWPV